ncbi:sensor histidine kinase [Kribbella sp. NPDC058245]|uniref:sensor histidine kinase n=1 Tax=Kribbella sp. NPDC058245 TaxID=3346399 RepID=UPI0036EBA8BA
MELQDCPPTGRRWVWDVWVVLAVGGLTALTIVGRLADASHPRWVGLDVTIGIVSTALMVLVPRRPVPAAVALAVLAVFSPAATPASTATTMGIALRLPQRTAIIVTAIQIGAHLVQGAWRPIGNLPFLWFAVLDVAVHVAMLGWGQWIQARQQLLGNLLERAQRAEAEQGRRVAEARTAERTQMAREMHDVLAHRLSLLATYAGALEYRPDSSPEKLAQAAGVIRTGVHQALEELREVISVLRDTEIEEGPGGRPQPTFGDVEGLVAESRAAGTTVAYDERVDEATSLPPATGRTAYRVVQEGLTNARKHAAGHPVTVTVTGRPGTGLRIALTNPGSNGVPLAPGSGTGLVGLTERVQLAGGTLDHQREPGGGFRLEASLPWPA